MRDYLPFELTGPVGVYNAFYNVLAQHQRAISGIQAGTVRVAQLSEITADLGEVRAGHFITENLYWDNSAANGIAVFTGSGAIMSGAGWTVDGTNYYNLGGFNAGVLQFGLSATDGKAYAGAGVVVLDKDGVRILADETFYASQSNTLSFQRASTWEIYGQFFTYLAGTYPNTGGISAVTAFKSGSGVAKTLFMLDATPAINYFGLSTDDTHHPVFQDSTGQLQFGMCGHEFGTVAYASSSAEQTIYTRTITGGALGAKGGLDFFLTSRVYNGTGSGAKTVTYRYYYDDTLLATFGPDSVPDSTTRMYRHEGRLSNNGTTNSQAFGGFVMNNATLTNIQGTASEDSTANKVFKVTAQLNASNANLINSNDGGGMLGPYYHAA